MATDFCCGCTMEDDYGTSTVDGTGSLVDPFTVTLIDPDFIRPMVRVRMPDLQSILANTPTVVTFNTEMFDTDNMWLIGSPTRLTINTAGLYLMGASAFWASADITGTRELSFRINGTTEIESQDVSQNSAVLPLFQSLSYLWYFQPGEYIELIARQESAGTISFQDNDTSDSTTVFWACFVGKKV